MGRTKAKRLSRVWAAVEAAAGNVRPDQVKNLTSSMDKRILEVIRRTCGKVISEKS